MIITNYQNDSAVTRLDQNKTSGDIGDHRGGLYMHSINIYVLPSLRLRESTFGVGEDRYVEWDN
jgi:hypothetical protein